MRRIALIVALAAVGSGLGACGGNGDDGDAVADSTTTSTVSAQDYLDPIYDAHTAWRTRAGEAADALQTFTESGGDGAFGFRSHGTALGPLMGAIAIAIEAAGEPPPEIASDMASYSGVVDRLEQAYATLGTCGDFLDCSVKLGAVTELLDQYGEAYNALP